MQRVFQTLSLFFGRTYRMLAAACYRWPVEAFSSQPLSSFALAMTRSARRLHHYLHLQSALYLVVIGSAVAAILLLVGPAGAASGDIAIYREATAGDTITTANFDHSWDTTVREDSIYSTTTASSIALNEEGHYLVMYGSRFDQTFVSTSRTQVQTHLVLDGSPLPAGWSTGYSRAQSATDLEQFTSGGAIISASSSDVLLLRSFRTDGTTGITMTRAANTTGIHLLKLNDDLDYIRLRKSGTQTGPNSATLVAVTYDTQDELDTGSFTHSTSTNPENITLKTAGHYLVMANTYGSYVSTARTMVHQRLTLDGSDIDGTITTTYFRGSNNGNNILEGAVSTGVIIETTDADQVLNVELNRPSGTEAWTINQDQAAATVDRTAITIVKLPDSADYIRLDDTGTDAMNPTALTPLGWDTEDEKDTAAFTHSTSTDPSRIEVEVTDDYLFLSTLYCAACGVARGVWNQGWTIDDGPLISYGQTGNFDRNSGVVNSGNWSGIIFDNLAANSYIQVEAQALGNTGAIGADVKGVQGVRLGSFSQNFIQDVSDTATLAATAALGFSRTDTGSIGESIAQALGFNPSDTPSLAESMAAALGFNPSDTPSLAESIETLLGRRASDSATIAESIAAALGFNPTDAPSLAESIATALGLSRSDSATLSESALTQLGRPASDTATIAESIAAALGFNPTDTSSLAESLAAVLGASRSDSAALGESATAVLGFARTETPGLAESIAAALGFSPSDTTTLAESADAALGFSRSDTTTLVDSAATAFGFPRSDTATLAESIATQLGRTPSDAASLAESVAAALGFSRSDTSNVAETVAAAWGFSRTDTATLAESIETQSGRAASNAASIADSVAAALGFNPTDTPSLAESIAVAVGFSRTDTATLAESIKTLLGRPASDAATLAESLAAALGFSRSDTPILAEATVAALGFSRSDTATLVESVLTQRGRPLSDTLALGESLAAALGFSRSDAASVGEASVAAVSFLRSDTASFQEFVVSLFGKPVSESASIGESLATALGFSRTDTANLGELGTAALGFSRSDGASLAESILSVLGVSPSEASDLAESLIASLGFSRSDKSGLLASFTLGFSRPEAAGVLDAMMLGFPRADEAILADTVKFVVVPAEADLEVAKGVSSDPAPAGTILTYTVIVSNNGPKHASGVIVTDILPDNVSFDSASASQGTCTEALGIVTCDLGKIDKDGIAAVTIDIIPSLDAIGTTITGTASVTSAVNDPTSGNNSVGQDTAVVAGADLSVTKSDSPDPVLVGDPLAYTVTVANNGPAEATGVVLTDTLPGPT